MIANFLNSLKNPARLSLLITVFFFLGIMASAYFLYTLPQELIHSQAIHVLDTAIARMVFLKPAIVVVITFALGVFALNVSARSKKEIIVFVDKVKTDQQQNVSSNNESDTGDLGAVKGAMQQAQDRQASLQAGVNTICDQMEAGTAALYAVRKADEKRFLELKCGFALPMGESQTLRFEFGEGLVGQSAASGKNLYVDEVPEGYIKVISGLGTAYPKFLFLVALKREDETVGVFELATFKPLNETTRKRIEEMGTLLVEKIS